MSSPNRHSRCLRALALGCALALGTTVASAQQATDRPSIDEARLDPGALEQAALRSLQSSVETLSQGRAVAVEIVDLRVAPSTLASVAVDGVGRLKIEQGEWIPLRFTAGYDLQDTAMFGLRVLPIASHAHDETVRLDGATVERVNGLAEFPDQPAEVVFIDLQPTQHARGHVVFRGTGLVDFADEGAAPIEFSALLDRASGLVVSMDYQLDVAGAHGAASAATIAAR
jgi:hypothetical protein